MLENFERMTACFASEPKILKKTEAGADPGGSLVSRPSVRTVQFFFTAVVVRVNDTNARKLLYTYIYTKRDTR